VGVFAPQVLPHVGGMEPWLGFTICGFRADHLTKMALATPVQYGVGWRFHSGAVKALLHNAANMDVLVALGTNAAYAYSILAMLATAGTGHNTHDYFGAQSSKPSPRKTSTRTPSPQHTVSP
jgi:Cu+-exporting ATPase